MDFCVDACTQSGVYGEILAIGLILARLLYAEFKRYKLSGKLTATQEERNELAAVVKVFTNPPPASVAPVQTADPLAGGSPQVSPHASVPSLEQLNQQIQHANIDVPSLSPPSGESLAPKSDADGIG